MIWKKLFKKKTKRTRVYKMRYAKVRSQDISNGPGFRVSLFVQGCNRHCPNCFNQETWDLDGGYSWTKQKEDKLLELCGVDYIDGLSILGGEPLLMFEKGYGEDYQPLIQLVKHFKELYPEKTIWVWSGYNFEDMVERPSRLRIKKVQEFLKYIDVLVDGEYIDSLNELNLKYRGSKNQRVIDVQKSLENHSIILYTPEI